MINYKKITFTVWEYKFTFSTVIALFHLHTQQSIEGIHDVIMTSDRPVVVTCGDLEDYICKYRYPERLLNELLAWAFLKEWSIPTPEACLVQVRSGDVLPEWWVTGARPPLFEKPCFGSRRYQYAREIDNSLTALGANRSDVRKIQNRSDFLRIALFDLWMANEDRNGNNYNLLLVPLEPGKFFIYAIDHGACFNSGQIGSYPLVQLTEEDSVLSTNICRLLYVNQSLLKREGELVLASFRQNVEACVRMLPKIMTFVPPGWKIKTVDRQQWLIDNLFTDTWLNQTEESFRYYLQRAVR